MSRPPRLTHAGQLTERRKCLCFQMRHFCQNLHRIMLVQYLRIVALTADHRKLVQKTKVPTTDIVGRRNSVFGQNNSPSICPFLARGDPSSVLPIVSYAFVSYSSHVAEHLVKLGVELAGKNDLRFVETVYKVLRDVFHYKPLLTKQQFLQPGFAEHKIGILCDVIGFVIRKHEQLCKVARPSFQKRIKSGFPSLDPLCKTEKLPATDAVTSGTFSKLPLVERHIGGMTSAFTNPLCDEADSEAGSEASSEGEEPEAEDPPSPDWPTEPQVRPTPSLPLWQIGSPPCHARDLQVDEARLQALEAQLQECQAKLEKLSSLERRLQALERDTAGKVIVDREQWENLESRVLLLETRLALSSAQAESSMLLTEKNDITSQEAFEAGPGTSSALRSSPAGHRPPEASPIPVTDVSKGTLKRLERIASMMKDTSCLLKSADPSS